MKKIICFLLIVFSIFFICYQVDLKTKIFSNFHLNPFKKPAISVVMSTYNRESLLPTAIETILNQTFKDFEFIIINDGSIDKTAEVLAHYAQKDKRIQVITNEKNLGLIDSLNKGLAVAKGKYIARMDDDDKSVLTRFQLQYDYMEKNPEITVTGTSQHAYDDGFFVPVKEVFVEENSEKTSVIAHFNVPILHPSAMIRHDFIKKHNIHYKKGYDSAEDTPFWFSIVKNGGKIIKLTPPLVVNKLDSPKKEGYYGKQISSFAKFLNNNLKDIRGTYVFQNRWLEKSEVCFILHQLQKNKKEYYSSEGINLVLKEKGCYSNSVILNLNKDNLIIEFDEDKYFINEFSFSLLERKDNTLILMREEIRLELNENNGVYQITDNMNFIKIKHPDWNDYAFVTPEKILFLSGDREAKLISFNESILEIEFLGWGKEIFERDDKGIYNFKMKKNMHK